MVCPACQNAVAIAMSKDAKRHLTHQNIPREMNKQLLKVSSSKSKCSFQNSEKALMGEGSTSLLLVRPRVNSSNDKSMICYDEPIAIIVKGKKKRLDIMDFAIPSSNGKGLKHRAQ